MIETLKQSNGFRNVYNSGSWMSLQNKINYHSGATKQSCAGSCFVIITRVRAHKWHI